MNTKGIGEHYGGYEFHGSNDTHYSLFTPYHVHNYLQSTGFNHITSSLYQRDKFGWKLNFIHGLLRVTRFSRMTYPQIRAWAFK